MVIDGEPGATALDILARAKRCKFLLNLEDADMCLVEAYMERKSLDRTNAIRELIRRGADEHETQTQEPVQSMGLAEVHWPPAPKTGPQPRAMLGGHSSEDIAQALTQVPTVERKDLKSWDQLMKDVRKEKGG